MTSKEVRETTLHVKERTRAIPGRLGWRDGFAKQTASLQSQYNEK